MNQSSSIIGVAKMTGNVSEGRRTTGVMFGNYLKVMVIRLIAMVKIESRGNQRKGYRLVPIERKGDRLPSPGRRRSLFEAGEEGDQFCFTGQSSRLLPCSPGDDRAIQQPSSRCWRILAHELLRKFLVFYICRATHLSPAAPRSASGFQGPSCKHPFRAIPCVALHNSAGYAAKSCRSSIAK